MMRSFQGTICLIFEALFTSTPSSGPDSCFGPFVVAQPAIRKRQEVTKQNLSNFLFCMMFVVDLLSMNIQKKLIVDGKQISFYFSLHF